MKFVLIFCEASENTTMLIWGNLRVLSRQAYTTADQSVRILINKKQLVIVIRDNVQFVVT